MIYIIYADDGSKIDELDDDKFAEFKERYSCKTFNGLNDFMKQEYGYHIEKVEEGDYKYIIIQSMGGKEDKFRTFDEIKDWIKGNTYADPSAVKAWKNFDELKEYIDREYGGYYKVRTFEKSREQKIYDRLCNIKRPNKVFKVGARVRAVGVVSFMDLKGKEGTLCHIKDSEYIGINFDDNIGGNDCEGHARDEHGRYGIRNEFELI